MRTVEAHSPSEYETLCCAPILRASHSPVSTSSNPRTQFALGWHFRHHRREAGSVREGQIRRLIINVPPRHLKSHLASVAFPAWCLGRDPSMQILCVSYAQDLADKLSRDCRHIVARDWY